VVLIGPPNTGKSSLLAAATNAEARVADYPFTTVVPQPGMWAMDDVQIELVDTPPFTAEHVPAGLMGTIHNADVVWWWRKPATPRSTRWRWRWACCGRAA